ncbi:hypothetical protein CD798_08280 [Bacillaceae bacterium SAOS 7]|nr:hypothetical protein CD798_08280 [Bacillaceae bacterium SAOS 7]
MSKITHEIIPIFAYKISNPITNIDTNIINDTFYSYKLFEKFLDLIIGNQPSKFMDGSKYIDLISTKQSSDAEILEGKIHTTRYGSLSNILNVKTNQVVGQLNPTEGVVNEINFVICRKTGLLLIQSDPFRVATRNFINEYFNRKQTLANKLVDTYNSTNHPNHIYKEFLFTMETLVDQDFYTQLARIARIKELSITAEITKSNDNSALDQFKVRRLEEDHVNVEGVTELVYTLRNKVFNDGLKHVERFVRNVIDLEKVSKLEAKGYNEACKVETASFSIKPVKFYVNTTKNSNGILDQSEIIEGMIQIVKTKNPLNVR